MRICRFRHQGQVSVGFYDEAHVVPLPAAAEAYARDTGQRLELADSECLLDFLPPEGSHWQAARELARWLADGAETLPPEARLATGQVELLVPIARPNKLLLLAGNYASHIEEGGQEVAAERAETFPYVFMKPPSTTLNDPGKAVRIPAVSPDTIDWELELAVVIGKRARRVKESEALQYVAGYTVVNDISDRQFRPNPQRKSRDRDPFFDWLHGKWHDSSCPCGPCIASADQIPDPQTLKLELRVNGQLKQQASTAQQIFPVAAVIEFLSQFVTLEPGDIISTGTTAGVGHTTASYLKPGDRIEATISQIGTLVSPVEAES